MFFNNRKCPCDMPQIDCGPIMEKPIEKCIQRDIVHEVEHICPINTRIINNHIYKHVYRPHYTCEEENMITNLDECGCNNMYNYFEN